MHRALRDATRGGVGTVCNELAQACGLGVLLSEERLPVRPMVNGACELLGIDPLYVANEGKFVAVDVVTAEADLPARCVDRPVLAEPASLVEHDELVPLDNQADRATPLTVEVDQAQRERLRLLPIAIVSPDPLPAWCAVPAIENRHFDTAAISGDVDDNDLAFVVAVEVSGGEGRGAAILAALAEPLLQEPAPERPAIAQGDGSELVVECVLVGEDRHGQHELGDTIAVDVGEDMRKGQVGASDLQPPAPRHSGPGRYDDRNIGGVEVVLGADEFPIIVVFE